MTMGLRVINETVSAFRVIVPYMWLFLQGSIFTVFHDQTLSSIFFYVIITQYNLYAQNLPALNELGELPGK